MSTDYPLQKIRLSSGNLAVYDLVPPNHATDTEWIRMHGHQIAVKFASEGKWRSKKAHGVVTDAKTIAMLDALPLNEGA